MKRCYTRRRVDNATLFFSFLSFSNVLRSHEHLQPRRHSIVQRERKDRDTDIQQSGRSRVPIQSRNEVDPLYKYTWRKKKKKKKRKQNLVVARKPFGPFSSGLESCSCLHARIHCFLDGWSDITLLNFEISSRYWVAHNGGEGTRLLLCQRNTATLSCAPFQNKLSHTYRETLFKTASELCCREDRTESEQIGSERRGRKIKGEGREKEGGTELSSMVCEL